MANLIDVANELEYVPKDQLASFVNDPDSRYPSYMVLSEIQRRTQLEKAYNAEQAAMEPNTTVADEVVANFTGQGLASAMPPTEMNPQEAGMQGMQGIQMMAEGGRTGYQEGGKVGSTFLNDVWNSDTLNFRDPDGSINWTKAGLTGLTAATMFNPIGLGARGALAAARYGIPALAKRFGAGYAKNISAPIGSAAFKAMSPKMKNAYIKRMTAEGAKYAGKKSVPLKALGSTIQRRAALTGGLGAMAYGASPDGVNNLEGNQDDNQGDVRDIPTSISGDAVSRKPEASFDPLDMARMGFALMGARDTSELASGLSGITEDIQSRRREQPLIDAQLKELEAKVNYYNSQGEYNKADQIAKLASTLATQIEAMLQIGDMEGASEAAQRLGQINNELSRELGIESTGSSNPVEEAAAAAASYG